ncbi:MAG TPA: patatin-like phospholipase family protein [Acidimicrobiales bacterium]|nr:patatin-like phospholipase family protein [Acidimicrobiales bacterium]
MLSATLDIFRLRQYFNALTRARQWVDGLREDAGLAVDVRRAMLPLPSDRPPERDVHPFGPCEPVDPGPLEGRRLALMATGGSGALASVVGVARALEESGVRPAVISLCSGSALFGFPLAAGLSAADVAEFVLSLEPSDYVDLDWAKLATLLPTGGRGFAGMLRGDRVEATYRSLLGAMTLGELAIPAYAPVWNVEENRLEYLGPRTTPELSVARAVRMAIALPLFVAPVEMQGRSWCDGGIVDIFPVRPVLDIERERCDLALAVNGFYPPDFAGEDESGWEDRRASILYVASQVRTAQQAELARVNLARLRSAMEVRMIEPVSYEVVRGVGFYRQFLSTRAWPEFMRAGRRDARRVLSAPKRPTAGPAPAASCREDATGRTLPTPKPPRAVRVH